MLGKISVIRQRQFLAVLVIGGKNSKLMLHCCFNYSRCCSLHIANRHIRFYFVSLPRDFSNHFRFANIYLVRRMCLLLCNSLTAPAIWLCFMIVPNLLDIHHNSHWIFSIISRFSWNARQNILYRSLCVGRNNRLMCIFKHISCNMLLVLAAAFPL